MTVAQFYPIGTPDSPGATRNAHSGGPASSASAATTMTLWQRSSAWTTASM